MTNNPKTTECPRWIPGCDCGSDYCEGWKALRKRAPNLPVGPRKAPDDLPLGMERENA